MKIAVFADNFIEFAGIRYIVTKIFPDGQITEISDIDKIQDFIKGTRFEFFVYVEKIYTPIKNVDLSILLKNYSYLKLLLILEVFNIDKFKTTIEKYDKVSLMLKHCSEDEFRAGLKSILNGNRYICNDISNHIIKYSNKDRAYKSEKKILTATETEILKEITLGKTTKEIANIRHVSIHTVMTHRKNIFRKIDVNTVHEATKYAMRAGIVELAEYYI